MKLWSRLREALRKAPAGRPQGASRVDKYNLDGAREVLAKMREAELDAMRQQVARVQEASRKVRVGRFEAAMDGGESTFREFALDSSDSGLPTFKSAQIEAGQSEMTLMPWFMKQGFIGYQNAAFLAQHWLVYKACATPVDDAVRNGYDVTTADGDDLPLDALKIIKRWDRKFGIGGQLRDFGTKGRIFGLRIALFLVDSDDPDYYIKPYNPDGVKPGSYRGISQIDPYWVAPILDAQSAGVPSTKHFYEPTWWLIGSMRVHRSHLVLFRYADPPDVLKPLYLFGGIPLPQMIMERVYCAERTANEAPALALSKRTTVWLTDMAKVMADSQKAQGLLSTWIAYRDNFGIKLGDKEGDAFQQFDTPLADFDGLVMTQYSLVAATAGVPITKLLGTTPGGFAATGEYDESSYHEMLESLQDRDLTPLLERHHELVMLSYVVPKFPQLKGAEIVVKWRELDALTHVELATVNLSKAQTGAALVASGALGPEDERARIAEDRESGYHGIGIDLETERLPDDDDPQAAAEATRGRGYVAGAAVQAETGARTE